MAGRIHIVLSGGGHLTPKFHDPGRLALPRREM
jgi:hypothetical protein